MRKVIAHAQSELYWLNDVRGTDGHYSIILSPDFVANYERVMDEFEDIQDQLQRLYDRVESELLVDSQDSLI